MILSINYVFVWIYFVSNIILSDMFCKSQSVPVSTYILHVTLLIVQLHRTLFPLDWYFKQCHHIIAMNSTYPSELGPAQPQLVCIYLHFGRMEMDFKDYLLYITVFIDTKLLVIQTYYEQDLRYFVKRLFFG